MAMRKDLSFMIQAVNKTAEPFAEVENGIERLNQATARASTLVFAEQRAQNFLIATYRQKYRSVYDTLGLMRNVGSIGNQIISIVNAQNIAQIRLRDSLIDVEDAQLRFNTALGLFGEDSVQYEDALDDIERAQNRYADAANDEKWKNLGIAASLVGMTAQVGMLITKLGEMGALGTIGPIGVAIAVSVTGMAALKTLGEKLADVVEEETGVPQPDLPKPGTPEFEEEGMGLWPGVTYFPDIGEELYDPLLPSTGPGAGGRGGIEGFGTTLEDFASTLIEDFQAGLETWKGVTRDTAYTEYEREKIGAAGSTTNIEVNVETNASPERIADEIAWEMAERRREDW